MNCPKCYTAARIKGGETVGDKKFRRRVCRNEECGLKFRVELLKDGNEVFVNEVGSATTGPKVEFGVKQRRKTIDYAAAIHEIRSAAIGTLYVPWRTI